MTEYVTRFSVRQRLEHLAIMLVFILLALTGLAQRFFEASWARFVIEALGGIDQARWLHRVAGILFAVLAGLHLLTALTLVFLGRTPPSIVPARKDFKDAVVMLRYYLGLSEETARFDRYDYRQKFEYWGLVLGGAVMIVTGFILYFPATFARFLPGEIIPAAKVAHGYEGMLAFLVVIIWHIYNAHLSPEVFPFDSSIFTGKISRERMEKEHPLEWARMQEDGEQREPREHD